MEITVINRTTRTMTDLSVELSVTGSFNIIEKPAKVTLDAGERKELRAIIKVNSTETGFIFGSVTFSYSSSAEHVVVNLNEVSVSLMEYIKPADWWARRRGVRRSIDAIVYFWIFISLMDTMDALREQKQEMKLAIYTKLRNLFIISVLVATVTLVGFSYVVLNDLAGKVWKYQWL